ncbi:MAG: hypothetical protein IK062_06670 [Selenomonadaceae bacterium]|nr:hypothetical protein [Selenomonadaceae bacterium]
MRKKKFVLLFGLGIIGSYSLIAYAHTVPGWDEPYDIDLYYSLTEISWADSPSPYALKDLASNGGDVYNYTRHLKSIIFGEKFEKTAETAESKTKNEEKNSKPFSEEIFSETAEALKIIGIGTEKIAREVSIDETNPYLRQGNSDDWESYDQNSYNREEKFKWLSDTYRNFADGAKTEIDETEKSVEAAKKIFNHTNLAEGNLQMYQAQNELKTLLAYELARQNALDSNFEQMQAVYQAAEYDENVESAYIDLITKFDVADPHDEVNYKILNEEYGYTKPKLPSMPNFK